MRLNRVLLLAATINILIFALVFTISCADGADGKNGKDGTYCIVDQDWNLVCDNSPVGQLTGKPGKDGKNGKDGKDGEGCWLGTKTATGGYDIFCGTNESNGEYKGTLDGCFATTMSKYEVVFTCGSQSVNICSGQVFDPTLENCAEDGDDKGTIVEGKGNYILKCGNTQTEYDRRTHYCGYSEADTTDAAKNQPPTTVFAKCGGVGNPYLKDNHQPNEPRNELAAGEGDGQGYAYEYCRYFDTNKAYVAGGEIDGKTGDYCGGGDDPQPLNKDSWKKEYCGFKSKNAVVKTVIVGACDRPAESQETPAEENSLYPEADYWSWIGPNEKAFGQGYCEVLPKDRLTGKTTYSENFCGGDKINAGKWEAQYCGFKDKSSTVWDKVYKPICDDGNAPNRIKIKSKKTGLDSIVRKDYCSFKPDGLTELREFCGTSGKPNAAKWNKEYCGLDKKTLTAQYTPNIDNGTQTDNLDYKEVVYSGVSNAICDFGEYGSSGVGGYATVERTTKTGAKQKEYANGPYSFKAFLDRTTTGPKYGAQSAAVVAGGTGAPSAGDVIPAQTWNEKGKATNATNNTNYWNGYCKGLPSGKTVLAHSLDTCAASGAKRPNAGKWNKDYCALTADAIKTGITTGANVIFEAGYKADFTPVSEQSSAIAANGAAGAYVYTTLRARDAANKDKGIKLASGGACEDGSGPNDGFTNIIQLSGSLGAHGLPPITTISGSGPYTNKLKVDPFASVGGNPPALALRYNKNNYCTIVNTATPGNKVILSRKTTATNPCYNSEDKPNNGKWENMYCGYSTGSATKLNKQSNLCGDGYGTKSFNTVSGLYDGFCQWPKKEIDGRDNLDLNTVFIPLNWKTNANSDGTYKKYKITAASYAANAPSYEVSGYCGLGSTAKEYNKGSWQNQYCYRTDVLNDKTSVTTTSYSVGACPGGKYSKQSYALRYPATGPTSANSGYYIYKGGDAAYLRCTGGEGSSGGGNGGNGGVNTCDEGAITSSALAQCLTSEQCEDIATGYASWGGNSTDPGYTTPDNDTDSEYYWDGQCRITTKAKCLVGYTDDGYDWGDEDHYLGNGVTTTYICGKSISPSDPESTGGCGTDKGWALKQGTCKKELTTLISEGACTLAQTGIFNDNDWDPSLSTCTWTLDGSTCNDDITGGTLVSGGSPTDCEIASTDYLSCDGVSGAWGGNGTCTWTLDGSTCNDDIAGGTTPSGGGATDCEIASTDYASCDALSGIFSSLGTCTIKSSTYTQQANCTTAGGALDPETINGVCKVTLP